MTDMPVIGLTTYEEPARWGVWDTSAVLLPSEYVDGVRAAGGIPVLLPSVPGVQDVVARLDGLVLSGGADVDPARYDAPAHALTGAPRPRRDDAELALLEAALAQGLPVLAVCRGMQLLNVARGGTLFQHVPDQVGHLGHNPRPGVYGRPPVGVLPGTRLAGLLGAGGQNVSCHHHQAVDRIGQGLVVSAATEDGVVEGLEDPSLPFLLGVQWHPEVGEDARLFGALVDAARTGAARSSAARAGGARQGEQVGE